MLLQKELRKENESNYGTLKIVSAGYGCTRPIFHVGNIQNIDTDCADNMTHPVVNKLGDRSNLDRNRRIDMRFVFRSNNAGAKDEF